MKNIFVINIDYIKPLEEVEKYITKHREFLTQGYKDGVFVMSGGKNPRTGGIIIGRFASKDDALTYAHKDPFFIEKVAEYDVIEFAPTKYASELEEYLRLD